MPSVFPIGPGAMTFERTPWKKSDLISCFRLIGTADTHVRALFDSQHSGSYDAEMIR